MHYELWIEFKINYTYLFLIRTSVNEMNFGLGTLILPEKTLPIYYLQKKNRMEISVLATTFTIIVERKHKYVYILHFILPFLKVQSLLENKKYTKMYIPLNWASCQAGDHIEAVFC